MGLSLSLSDRVNPDQAQVDRLKKVTLRGLNLSRNLQSVESRFLDIAGTCVHAENPLSVKIAGYLATVSEDQPRGLRYTCPSSFT